MEKLAKYLIKNYPDINREISDLDLFEVIKKIDCSSSALGKQFLCFKVLNSIKNVCDLNIELPSGIDYNSRYIGGLQYLNKQYNLDIVDIVFGDKKLDRHWSFNYSPYLLVLIFLSLICFKYSPYFFTVLLTLLLVISVFIYYITKGIILNSKYYFLNIADFSKTCNSLKKISGLLPFETKNNNYNFLIKILTVEDKIEAYTPIGVIISTTIEITKAIFLIDSIIINRLASKISFDQEKLKHDYLLIGQIDFNLSLIKFKERMKDDLCSPTFDNSQGLVFKNLKHPLVDNCVQNSINISDRVIIVTGSNMAGKSTFIKALAVNIILGKALKICFASSVNIDNINLFTSIKVSDNLLKSKSYFDNELDIMKNIITNSTITNSIIFLDEPFKGTNSMERTALSVGVIKYLYSKKSKIVLTTHDLKLYDFLKDISVSYHFNLSLKEDSVFFDFKLRKGIIENYYAIKILKNKKFPEAIINDSMSTMNFFEDEG
jgi:hypothetical protein